MTTPTEIKKMMKAEKNGVQPAKEFEPEIFKAEQTIKHKQNEIKAIAQQFDFQAYLLECLTKQQNTMEEMQSIIDGQQDEDRKFNQVSKLHETTYKSINALIQFIRIGQFEMERKEADFNFKVDV